MFGRFFGKSKQLTNDEAKSLVDRFFQNNPNFNNKKVLYGLNNNTTDYVKVFNNIYRQNPEFFIKDGDTFKVKDRYNDEDMFKKKINDIFGVGRGDDIISTAKGLISIYYNDEQFKKMKEYLDVYLYVYNQTSTERTSEQKNVYDRLDSYNNEASQYKNFTFRSYEDFLNDRVSYNYSGGSRTKSKRKRTRRSKKTKKRSYSKH